MVKTGSSALERSIAAAVGEGHLRADPTRASCCSRSTGSFSPSTTTRDSCATPAPRSGRAPASSVLAHWTAQKIAYKFFRRFHASLHAALRDMQFVMHEGSVRRRAQGAAGHADIDADTINAVLEEGGKFASQVLAPLNGDGDIEGCTSTRRRTRSSTPTAPRTPMPSTSQAAGPRFHAPGARRPGPAAAVERVLLRDAQRGEPGLDDVAGPAARRLRVPARTTAARS